MSGNHSETAALPLNQCTWQKLHMLFCCEFLPISGINCVSLPIRGVRKRIAPVSLVKSPVIPRIICVRAKSGILEAIVR